MSLGPPLFHESYKFLRHYCETQLNRNYPDWEMFIIEPENPKTEKEGFVRLGIRNALDDQIVPGLYVLSERGKKKQARGEICDQAYYHMPFLAIPGDNTPREYMKMFGELYDDN